MVTGPSSNSPPPPILSQTNPVLFPTEGAVGLPHRSQDSPGTEARLGRMVMAPRAAASSPCTGAILAPQLSEPTQEK